MKDPFLILNEADALCVAATWASIGYWVLGEPLSAYGTLCGFVLAFCVWVGLGAPDTVSDLSVEAEAATDQTSLAA